MRAAAVLLVLFPCLFVGLIILRLDSSSSTCPVKGSFDEESGGSAEAAAAAARARAAETVARAATAEAKAARGEGSSVGTVAIEEVSEAAPLVPADEVRIIFCRSCRSLRNFLVVCTGASRGLHNKSQVSC